MTFHLVPGSLVDGFDIFKDKHGNSATCEIATPLKNLFVVDREKKQRRGGATMCFQMGAPRRYGLLTSYHIN